MSKRGFYIYLGFLAALILFSLSPLAGVAGVMLVIIVIPIVSILLVALGQDISGDKFDMWLYTVFAGFTALLVMLALWCFYRAADFSEKGEPNKSRRSIAIALTLITVPMVTYFLYQSLTFL